MPPAARSFDGTSHGGVIVGPGCPNVLIGGRPAARVGDLQVCPVVDGTKPHVGGPIGPGGSFTVLIAGAPAARVDDRTQCVGPPGTIAAGCPTVLIG